MVSIKEPVHFDRLSSGHSPLHPPTSVRFSPSSSRLDSSLDQLEEEEMDTSIFRTTQSMVAPGRCADVVSFFFLGRPYILYDRLLLLLYVGQRERETYRIITRAVLLCPLSVPGRVRVVTAAKERKKDARRFYM